MAKFQRHVFICTNRRADGHPTGCCASKGADDVASAFKVKLFEQGCKRIVRPNKAGCLDQCAKGVCVVIYPDAVWYGNVTVDDVDEIIASHVVGGRPVERLLIPDDELTGIDPVSGIDGGGPAR